MDLDSFLVSLYVLTEDWWKTTHYSANVPTPGRPALISEAEILTLVILAQWPRFRSERDFWRFAYAHLREYFPTLLSTTNPRVAEGSPYDGRREIRNRPGRNTIRARAVGSDPLRRSFPTQAIASLCGTTICRARRSARGRIVRRFRPRGTELCRMPHMEFAEALFHALR
jgi:hypothetical protein